MSVSVNGVRRILGATGPASQVIGVARNFENHCKELKNPVLAISPAFFYKSPSSIVFPPETVQIPTHSGKKTCLATAFHCWCLPRSN